MMLGLAMLSLSLLVEPGGLTAEDALARIRAARKGGDLSPAVVTVRGRNVLSRTLCFTAEDHDIAFVGESGASFSGGLRLSGWRDLGRGVWETEAPRTESGETAFFDQLWVDGRRASNARLPDEGWLEISSATQIVAAAGSGAKYVERVTFADERTKALARVPKEDCPWLRVGVICKWAYGQRTLDGYDPGTRTVTTLTDFPWKAWKRWQPDNSLVAFFNVRSAFDAPGEWFLDRKAGKVRYRPRAGENPSAAAIVVPRPGLVRLLSFKADWARGECVRGISFRGIAFEHAASETDGNCPRQIDQLQAASAMDGMVSLEGVRGISFDGCRFAHCAGYGLRFHSACTSNRVTNCRITDPGAGGIWMGADYAWKDTRGEIGRKVIAPVRPDAVAFNVVSNCVISGGGRYNPEGVGVCLSHCSDTRIVHNDIHDCMYSGISVGWTWGFSGSVSQRNDIGFNRIWDLGKGVMSDLGGVYTLGTSFGTTVHDNVIHDVMSRAYGGWGLYCDEGSEGIVEERNLCWNTDDGGFHQHYGVGCVIRNNIFAFNRRKGAVRMKRDVVDGVTCSLHFATNIVYGGSGPLVGEGVRRVAGAWSNNLWYDVRGRSAAEFDGLGWEAWAACGKETGGVFADPLFADPARLDFTLKPGSPALALGFRPFDTSAAGAVDEVRVSDFGFDAEDSTRYLQAAINTGARRVVIDRQRSAWITEPLFCASDQEIVFEKGVEVVAKKGSFRGRNDCLFTLEGLRNVKLSGYGATLRMHREDYLNPPYEKGEWRHGISILSSDGVTIEGLTILGSGGDGIYVADRRKGPCSRNVTVRDVVCDGHARQGSSIICVENLLYENCTFSNTKGRPPQAGIDIEPNGPLEAVSNCVFRNCRFADNAGEGFALALLRGTEETPFVSVRLEGCAFRGNRIGFSYCQNSKTPHHVKGGLILKDCKFERTRLSAFSIGRKPGDAMRVGVIGCRISDCCTEKPKMADVQIDSLYGNIDPPDTIALKDLRIVQPVERDWIVFSDMPYGARRNRKFIGDVTVTSPAGTKRIALDEAFRESVFPSFWSDGEPPRTKPDFARAEIVDTCPGKAVKLPAYRQRGSVRYVFHADRPGPIVFKGAFVKVGRSPVTVKTLTLAPVSGGAGTEVEVPMDKPAAFTVTVPSAGFYTLRAELGSHSFGLTESPVPVALDFSEKPLAFVRALGKTYLLVRRNRPFNIMASGQGIGERLGIELSDPKGRVVWSDPAVLWWHGYRGRGTLEEGLWTLRTSDPNRDHAEDQNIDLTGGPGVLFLSAEKYWK